MLANTDATVHSAGQSEHPCFGPPNRVQGTDGAAYTEEPDRDRNEKDKKSPVNQRFTGLMFGGRYMDRTCDPCSVKGAPRTAPLQRYNNLTTNRQPIPPHDCGGQRPNPLCDTLPFALRQLSGTHLPYSVDSLLIAQSNLLMCLCFDTHRSTYQSQFKIIAYPICLIKLR